MRLLSFLSEVVKLVMNLIGFEVVVKRAEPEPGA